jgi:hypothetical protein
VDAVAKHLQDRVTAYHNKFGTTSYPTIRELATGIHDGEKFFGVYMTASK